MGPKSRIPVSGVQEALQSPFAGLSISGLPEGREIPTEKKPRNPGRVVLRKEKAHRGGKTVVVVSGFSAEITDAEILEFSREAKKQCGCGGTVAGREVEFQGNNPEAIRRFFEAAGFRVGGI